MTLSYYRSWWNTPTSKPSLHTSLIPVLSCCQSTQWVCYSILLLLYCSVYFSWYITQMESLVVSESGQIAFVDPADHCCNGHLCSVQHPLMMSLISALSLLCKVDRWRWILKFSIRCFKDLLLPSVYPEYTEWTWRPLCMHDQLLFVAKNHAALSFFFQKVAYGRMTFHRTLYTHSKLCVFFWRKRVVFFWLVISKSLSVFCVTENTLSESVTEDVIKSIKDRQLLSLDNLPLISHDRFSSVLCNIFILLPLTNTSLFPDELSSTKHLIGHEWLHHQANDFISSSQPFVSRKLLAQLINLFPLKIT